MLRGLAVLLVVAVVLGGAGALAYRWSQDQYFVAEHSGRVAIFRGVQADVPGVRLNSVAEDTGITIASLPDYPTEQLAAGIPAESLADAREVVSRLTTLVRVCPVAGSGGRAPEPTPSADATLAPPDCVERAS